MKNTQQGNTAIILALVLVAFLAVASFMWSSQQQFQVAGPSPTPAVQSVSDLDRVSKDLDAVNVDSVDTGLKEISQNAAAI